MTITEGLGIEESFFESAKKHVHKEWSCTDTVSDSLINIANFVQIDEFGCKTQLSDYEKKLMLAGFFAGMVNFEHSMKSSLMRDLFESFESEDQS